MLQAEADRTVVRIEGDIFRMVESWRGQQSKIPSRAEAVRRLIELALTTNEARA